MRIIAFDQSLTATGAVLLETEGVYDQLKIVEQWVCDPGNATGIVRLLNIKAWMDRRIEGSKPFIMAREMHNQRTFGHGGGVHGLSAFLDELAWQGNYLDDGRYVIIPTTSWKKFCLKKGNFKKDTAYLLHVNSLLVANRWLDTPEGFIVEDDNIADAICIGICAFVAYRVKQRSLPDPEGLMPYERDVLKKKDSFFDYGKS